MEADIAKLYKSAKKIPWMRRRNKTLLSLAEIKSPPKKRQEIEDLVHENNVKHAIQKAL